MRWDGSAVRGKREKSKDEERDNGGIHCFFCEGWVGDSTD